MPPPLIDRCYHAGDSDDEEEIGALIYRSSATAKEATAAASAAPAREARKAAKERPPPRAPRPRPRSDGARAADDDNDGGAAAGRAGDSSGGNPSGRRPRRRGRRPILHGKSPEQIKPRLEDGTRVYSAWWPDAGRSSAPSWYPGTIRSHSLLRTPPTAAGGRGRGEYYGPARLYDVEFDDGDELDGVGDEYVFAEEDYLLQTSGGGRGSSGIEGGGEGGGGGWIGVTNVVDRESDDGWARMVGWYNVALFDGGAESHSLLAGASGAYSSSLDFFRRLPRFPLLTNALLPSLSLVSRYSCSSCCTFRYRQHATNHQPLYMNFLHCIDDSCPLSFCFLPLNLYFCRLHCPSSLFDKMIHLLYPALYCMLLA